MGMLLAAVACFSAASARGRNLDIDSDRGGKIKAALTAAEFSESSIQSSLAGEQWHTATIDARLKNRTFFSSNVSMDIHYQVTAATGDEPEAEAAFAEQYAGVDLPSFSGTAAGGDRTALLDMDSLIHNGSDGKIRHRLDRLNIDFQTSSAGITIGRQAVTWGNGLLFNPMDIINPFSPYDQDTDYKTGQDMGYGRLFLESGGDIQLLYAPRRDPSDGDVKFSESSLAAKYHGFVNSMEIDLMAGVHYEDAIVGAGLSGYLKGAAWRTDLVYTAADEDTDDNFASLVANIDYSWTMWDKNLYGFLEFYYSGIGEADAQDAYANRDLLERMGRGEVFVTGRKYLGAGLQVELTPLLNLDTTVSASLDDGSCLVQPRVVWSVTQNTEVTAGATSGFGSSNEAYGTISIPGTDLSCDTGTSVYLWWTIYF